jgi:hypothetical protein
MLPTFVQIGVVLMYLIPHHVKPVVYSIKLLPQTFAGEAYTWRLSFYWEGR